MDKRSIKNCFFCKRGDECIKEICLFAHTFEELNPTSCKWAGECKRRNCTYKHDHETKEEYAMRLFKYDMRRMGIFLPNIMNSEDVSSIQTILNYLKEHPELKNIKLNYFSAQNPEEIRGMDWGDADEYLIQKDINLIRSKLNKYRTK